jgi:hypothetical protein
VLFVDDQQVVRLSAALAPAKPDGGLTVTVAPADDGGHA